MEVEICPNHDVYVVNRHDEAVMADLASIAADEEGSIVFAWQW